MPVAVGARFGPYEVLSPLGAGGMGEVYRARDTRLDRTVALKVLSSRALEEPSRIERFRREARAISRLSHPHICTLHDLGEHEGVAFLVMEYVEGETLAARLEEGPLPIDQALRRAAQIAETLAIAHRQGVIHRDLKPSNVMLTREAIKLLDFGLAKLVEGDHESGFESTTQSLHLTEEGTLLGTMAYMAPEQLEGAEADARTDIFALGVVLYEMATGRRPFAGKNRTSLIAAILTSEPPPLATLQPMTSPPLERVVKRCLAKDREDRWQTAADLAAELRWILEGGSGAGVPRRAAPRRRGRAMAWGGALGAALGAAFAGVFLVGRSRPPLPSFERITFQRGTIASARFAPDGQTIVYGAAWEGRPESLFSTRRGSVDSRPLGLTHTKLLSISSAGEMALLLGDETGSRRTLARASLAGGEPRELLEGVIDADWTPDGSDLALVRRLGRKFVVEFPAGKKVYESDSRIRAVRVSPKGDRIALVEGVFLNDLDLFSVDRSGGKAVLTRGWTDLVGVAWSPGGDEVWFTASRGPDSPMAIRAVSLAGKERTVARMPAWLCLNDVRRDGTVLLGITDSTEGMVCLHSGETKERDLSWLDHSSVESLSSDGTTVLFAGRGHPGIGRRVAIYLRSTDGSPVVRLGEGYPEGLSPDGQWVVAARDDFKEWFLLPTHAGMQRTLPQGPILQLWEVDWLDDRRLVLSGLEPGRRIRVYVQDVEQGTIRPITPEGVNLPPYNGAPTPDRKAVLAGSDGKWSLYPVDGGDPLALPFLRPDDTPIRWSADGRVLYVVRAGRSPAVDIDRVTVATGRRDSFKTLSPPDSTGVGTIPRVAITPDGTSYCYTYTRNLGTFYVAEGLR